MFFYETIVYSRRKVKWRIKSWSGCHTISFHSCTKPQCMLKKKITKSHLLTSYLLCRDGFAASNFHQHCDNKGSTLTLIQSSEGYIFGGYSILPWESIDREKSHPEGFLFTLSNPHNIPPTMYPRNPQRNISIYCNPERGPVFGYENTDLRVLNNSNQNQVSDIFFPSCYLDTTGKGNKTFTGGRHFTTVEIEIYRVVYLHFFFLFLLLRFYYTFCLIH